MLNNIDLKLGEVSLLYKNPTDRINKKTENSNGSHMFKVTDSVVQSVLTESILNVGVF